MLLQTYKPCVVLRPLTDILRGIQPSQDISPPVAVTILLSVCFKWALFKPSLSRMYDPATQSVAPVSGRTLILMFWLAFRPEFGVTVISSWLLLTFSSADTSAMTALAQSVAFLLRQTLLKWPIRPQLLHDFFHVGHFATLFSDVCWFC